MVDRFSKYSRGCYARHCLSYLRGLLMVWFLILAIGLFGWNEAYASNSWSAKPDWQQATTTPVPDAVLRAEAEQQLELAQIAADEWVEGGDTGPVEKAFERALTIYRELGDVNGQAAVLLEMGRTLYSINADLEASRFAFKEALALYQLTDNTLGEATTLAYLGYADIFTKRYTEARSNLNQALGLFTELEDVAWQARTFRLLGELEFAEEHYAESRVAHQTALLLFTQIEDLDGQATARHFLCNLAYYRGMLEEAYDQCVAAGRAYYDLEDSEQVANLLNQLANIQWLRGDLGSAEELASDARTWYEYAELTTGQFQMIQALGRFTLEADSLTDLVANYEQLYAQLDGIAPVFGPSQRLERPLIWTEASIYFEEAEALQLDAADQSYGEASVQYSLGQLAQRRGELEVAREHFEISLELYRELDYGLLQATTLNSLGHLDLLEGDLVAAQSHFDAALALSQAHGLPTSPAYTWRSKGDLAVLQGRFTLANTYYETSETLFRQAGSRVDIIKVLIGRALLATYLGETERACTFYDKLNVVASDTDFHNDPAIFRLRQYATEHVGCQLSTVKPR